MLNYIWAGMIILSIAAALSSDIRDELNNKYKNDEQYFAKISPVDSDKRLQIIFSESFAFAPGEDIATNKYLKVELNDSTPDFWNDAIENESQKNKSILLIKITHLDREKKIIKYQLPEIHWVKLKTVTQAAFDIAKFAVKLAIGLAGVMALWLGLMRIAEKSGLIQYFVKLIYPLLHWLFPKIEKDNPVFGSISLNMAANVLGLGNAATPMGIKAMQQLQELNKDKEKASDEMCMFLAINTSSVQLLPPVTLIAIIGPSVSELMLPIIFATAVSTITAIAAAKYFARRESDNAAN